MKKYFVLALVALMSIAANAKSDKVFYDSKSDIIGISGQSGIFLSGFSSKFFKNDVELPSVTLRADKKGITNTGEVKDILNANKVGNKILKYILTGENGYISFDRLTERSLKNVSKAEDELAEAGEILSKEDELKDNVGPQFAKNYIYFETQSAKSSRIAWVVYRAVMDKETFERVLNIVMASPNPEQVSLNVLDDIDVPVECIKTGVAHTDAMVRLRDVGMQVADFAIRGQILRMDEKGGLYADCGWKAGVEKLDQMYIYRSFNKDGENYSKKIATARVVGVEQDKSRLYTVAGGWANSKKGDVAVLHNDNHMASNVLVGYQNKSMDVYYQHDFHLGMTAAGLSSYMLARIGVSYFLDSEDKLAEKSEYISLDEDKANKVPGSIYGEQDQHGDWYINYFDNWKKPLVVGLGFGYGVSWSLAHMLEVMPYAMVEAQYFYGASKEDDIASYNAIAGRVPVGVKANFNIPSYKLQLTAGVEFNVVHFGYNDVYSGDSSDSYGNKTDKKFTIMPYEWWNKSVAEPNHIRRTGLHFYVGARFCY